MTHVRLSLKAPPTVQQQVTIWLRELYVQLMALSARTLFGYAGGTVTLTASAATTNKTDTRIEATDNIVLIPTTANAKLEWEGKLSMDDPGAYVSTVADGSFTVTHSNTASADRTFSYIVFKT